MLFCCDLAGLSSKVEPCIDFVVFTVTITELVDKLRALPSFGPSFPEVGTY